MECFVSDSNHKIFVNEEGPILFRVCLEPGVIILQVVIEDDALYLRIGSSTASYRFEEHRRNATEFSLLFQESSHSLILIAKNHDNEPQNGIHIISTISMDALAREIEENTMQRPESPSAQPIHHHQPHSDDASVFDHGPIDIELEDDLTLANKLDVYFTAADNYSTIEEFREKFRELCDNGDVQELICQENSPLDGRVLVAWIRKLDETVRSYAEGVEPGNLHLPCLPHPSLTEFRDELIPLLLAGMEMDQELEFIYPEVTVEECLARPRSAFEFWDLRPIAEQHSSANAQIQLTMPGVKEKDTDKVLEKPRYQLKLRSDMRESRPRIPSSAGFDQERLERERREAEAKRQQQERLERERREAEAKRLQQERLEREKREAEAKRQQQERLERERREAEAKRQQQERLEREKREAEAKRQQQERLERKRREAEAKRLQQEEKSKKTPPKPRPKPSLQRRSTISGGMLPPNRSITFDVPTTTPTLSKISKPARPGGRRRPTRVGFKQAKAQKEQSSSSSLFGSDESTTSSQVISLDSDSSGEEDEEPKQEVKIRPKPSPKPPTPRRSTISGPMAGFNPADVMKGIKKVLGSQVDSSET